MKIISVVGARPQFIKASPVSRALRKDHTEILVHSGQHYDPGMSDVFFTELGIPAPDHNLSVGGGSHGAMTGEMLMKLEELFVSQKPDAVLIYGDTNTTLAAALAAAKMSIPVIHVEAGLRSFNREMPEEINRVLADHISDVLLCPTDAAVTNLAKEGIEEGVYQVGDVMLDTARHFGESVDAAPILAKYGVKPDSYYFATLHRASNSDSREALMSVIGAFSKLDHPVIWSVHPRTRKNIESFGLDELVNSSDNIIVTDPLPYTETITLLRCSHGLVTDSGGMQKEAYFFGVPCVTMRDETEWVETIDLGWNRLVGTDEEAILEAIASLSRPEARPDVYGTGHAAEAIVEAIEDRLGSRE